MREILKKLAAVKAPVCVTLILNTHKTHPENQKDSILLKNMIVTAKQRLQQEYGNEVADQLSEKLQNISDTIDHNHNDLALMLFVSENVSEYLRLPIRVHDRIILDDTFATRPIVRALKGDLDFFVLVLSRGKARLIEAYRDQVVKEREGNGFPITDNNMQAESRGEAANALRMTNLQQEFFNRIDKALNKIRKGNPLPVFIYSEETNYHQYLKEADYPNTILGHILLKKQDEKAENLVKEIWPKVKEIRIQKHRSRISELEKALNSGKILTDLNDIWRAVREGRGKTIFVEEGYFQAVKVKDTILSPIKPEEISSKEDINDIVDDMIEACLQFGGDVVFVEKGGLEKFNKIALSTRY